MVIEQVLFILIIAMLAYLTYAIYWKKAAERSFETTKRMLPSFLLWPSSVEDYVLLSKILVPVILMFVIGLYVYTFW